MPKQIDVEFDQWLRQDSRRGRFPEYAAAQNVTTLRTVRSATIEINGQHLTLDPDIPPAARELLTTLG